MPLGIGDHAAVLPGTTDAQPPLTVESAADQVVTPHQFQGRTLIGTQMVDVVSPSGRYMAYIRSESDRFR